MGEKEEVVSTIIGGDFNARTEKKGGSIETRERGEEGTGEGNNKRKRSKDGKMNREGKEMVRFLEEKGWGILNGSIKRDEEGEYTYTGEKENTAIDYVIGNGEVREKIRMMRIGDRIESDYQSVVI